MLRKFKLYPAHTVIETDTIEKTAKYMKKHNARYVYVVDKAKKPVGVISLYDIVFRVVAEKENPSKTVAKKIMQSPVDHVDIGHAPEFALNIMMKRHTYACLVTEKGKVKGLVDYKSVFEQVLKNMKEREAK
ncbi:MAG: CBS domain-containing protein [Candidatus Woesearchaeota archaeon]